MSKLKDFCCIVCNENITDSSTISIRDYMRPFSNISLYTFLQWISNFNLLDISEVPQNACDKCYQDALHVLDFQTLCNKAVENINTYSEDIKPVCIGNDCDDSPFNLPKEDIEDGCDVVEGITKNSVNVKDEDIASLSEEDTKDGYDVVEILTNNSDNAKDDNIESLPALISEEDTEDDCGVGEIITKHSGDAEDEDIASIPTCFRKKKQNNPADPKNPAEKVECEYCHNLYRRDYMAKHKRIHTDKRPYKCKLCPKDFNTGTQLNNHMRFHNNERPYECEICGMTFYNKSIHKNHYATHSDARPFACSECPQRFKLNKTLKRHMIIHPKIKPFKCTFCGERFTQSDGLQKHQATSCQGPKNTEASLIPAEDSEDDYDIDEYNKQQQLAEKVECEHCHKLYSRDYMYIHRRVHTAERPLKCKLCPKDFRNMTALKYHMENHSEERPYVCDVCGKTFRHKDILNAHYSTHSDARPFACADCPKRFRLKKLLRKHMKIHVKNGPVECTFCGERFIQPDGLQKHQETSCQGLRNNDASLEPTEDTKDTNSVDANGEGITNLPARAPAIRKKK